ncbi:MAG: ribonuclease Y [Firmicutes bacterium]|jgi:ribonuclease Y|nr:ribonuclease Y [Bacillota bacterium]MDD6831019.1 ribonuclease Y [Bacillota bacterium]MDY5881477.1 ribonuclease Y [Oscillospiraceae bacterium]CCX71452.1 ribonuclease Y [Firmicutes bacterium CAG:555]
MKLWLAIVLIIVAFAVAFFLGVTYRKKVAEREIMSAEDEAKRIINDAIKNAESKKREALVEAKEEIHKNRSEYEREEKARRADLQKQERRLQQKEENLDRKTDSLERKNESLAQKISAVEAQQAEIALIKKSQLEMLEKVSGYTVEEAKNYLINALKDEVTHEMAVKVKEIEAQYKEEADERAREIIVTAIQRCAADHASEVTVSVVPLPNDEMKGRIIGREGRNIRSIETLTGCDLIIDDTPEAITVSSFDPVRREVARIALEKLIADGRIHPARIEEMVAKAQKEVNATIKAEGERAVFETNIHGLNQELIKLLGRMRYRTSYGQNVLNHSIEVSHISGLIAAELGVDVATAKRAGLLHDIGKAIDHEVEGSHVTIGVEICKKYKESEAVIHAIEAHHGDVEPHTVVACIVQAADAISASRPGARRENIENYVKRLEKLEEISKSFPGIAGSYAIQAGREIRVMVKPEEVPEDKMVLLARDIAKKIEEELTYPGQIKVHVLRETKAVEYAK